ncbi:diguanylate cyclase [bacterium]|nr:diguanylate cyclase [bacterium]
MNPEDMSREQLIDELKELKKVSKENEAYFKLKEKYADLLQKYITIFSYLPVGIFRIDAKGYILEGNDAFCEILGYENLIELNDINLKDHYNNPRKFEELQRRLLREQNINEEFQLIRTDKKKLWIHTYSHAIYCDESEDIKFIYGVFIDITERKNFERELRRSGLVLEGVSFAAEQLLKDSQLEQNITEMLDSISFAIGASRAYVSCMSAEKNDFFKSDGIFLWTNIIHVDKLQDASMDNLPIYIDSEKNWHERLKLGETIFGTCDEFSEKESSMLKKNGIFSILIVPVFLEGSLWGIMGFEDCFDKRHWEAAELFAIRTAANILGAAIERTKMMNRLQMMSVTDEMTGLSNRRGFMILANQQMKMSSRRKSKLIFIFIDMDGLKWINDNLGHKDGDQAICDMAEVLQITFRDSDIVARIGGDEFVGIAIDSVEHGGTTIKERLNTVTKEFNSKEKRPFHLSASVGVTSYDHEESCNLDELLTRADNLMYEEKKKRKQKRGEKITPD